MIESSPQILDLIRESLSSEKLEILEVYDGQQAFERVLNEKLDLVILDSYLPTMDGFEVCKKLRREEIKIPIIMLIGKKDAVSRAKALARGADECVEKPFGANELFRKVKNQLKHISDVKKQAESLLKTRWEEINEGLRLITLIQRPFFHCLGELEMSCVVHHIPFCKIGGDFYKIGKVAENKIAILVGDTIGKGLAASFLTAATFAHLYHLIKTINSPAAVFNECNRLIRRDFPDLSVFVAAFIAFYNPEDKTIVYSSAGHHPPILVKKNQFKHRFLRSRGYFIGAFDDGQYEEVQLKLEEGDRIFFYTDGMLNIRNPDGSIISFSKFYKKILKYENMNLNELSARMVEYFISLIKSESNFRDDLTFILTEF